MAIFAGLIVTGFVVTKVWLGVAIMVMGASLPFLYHFCVRGPVFFMQVSVPLHFELTEDSLVVNTWCSRVGRWPVTDVQSVQVYKQTDLYTSMFIGSGSILAEGPYILPGVPVSIQHPDDVIRLLPSCKTLLSICCGRSTECTIAFLGARIAGLPEPVQLSRHVWCEHDVTELFECALTLRMFYEGNAVDQGSSEVPHQSIANRTGATEREIAALPTYRVSAQERRTGTSNCGVEGSEVVSNDTEGDVCSICLQAKIVNELVCRLPCAHEFHKECASRWLCVRAICPVCKRGLTSPSCIGRVVGLLGTV